MHYMLTLQCVNLLGLVSNPHLPLHTISILSSSYLLANALVHPISAETSYLMHLSVEPDCFRKHNEMWVKALLFLSMSQHSQFDCSSLLNYPWKKILYFN